MAYDLKTMIGSATYEDGHQLQRLDAQIKELENSIKLQTQDFSRVEQEAIKQKSHNEKKAKQKAELNDEITKFRDEIRRIESENSALKRVENEFLQILRKEEAQRKEEERKRKMKLRCPILIQELVLPHLISDLNSNISNASFDGSYLVSQPKLAFYGVNFTARFESTNLDLDQLNKFKAQVPGAQTVVLALTPGSADYATPAPDYLSTGEKVIQLYFNPSPPNKLNIPHCQKAFAEITGIVEGHRKQLI